MIFDTDIFIWVQRGNLRAAALMEGAKDPNSKAEYAPLISGLKANGVAFEVCEITMKRRDLKKEQFVMDADFVPSGVVRVTQLQTQNHFAYIKP